MPVLQTLIISQILIWQIQFSPLKAPYGAPDEDNALPSLREVRAASTFQWWIECFCLLH